VTLVRAITAAAVLLTAVTASAQTEDAPAARWRAWVAPTVGALALDPHLGDYRWDTSISVQPGIRAGVQHARWAAAVRTSWAGTEQATGVIGETADPDVHMTQLDLALEGRVVSLRGVDLWGSAHGGKLFLGYEPGEMTVDAGGTPVTVTFDPITEWCWGFGAAFRRDLTQHLALGLQVDQTTFRMDTAHRRGDEIVEARESFSNWSLALALMGFMDLD
jgi:hypothetical protein